MFCLVKHRNSFIRITSLLTVWQAAQKYRCPLGGSRDELIRIHLAEKLFFFSSLRAMLNKTPALGVFSFVRHGNFLSIGIRYEGCFVEYNLGSRQYMKVMCRGLGSSSAHIFNPDTKKFTQVLRAKIVW